MAESYDFVVIGAGSAGLTAAGFAAQLGVRIALLEKTRIGGDTVFSTRSVNASACVLT